MKTFVFLVLGLVSLNVKAITFKTKQGCRFRVVFTYKGLKIDGVSVKSEDILKPNCDRDSQLDIFRRNNQFVFQEELKNLQTFEANQCQMGFSGFGTITGNKYSFRQTTGWNTQCPKLANTHIHQLIISNKNSDESLRGQYHY